MLLSNLDSVFALKPFQTKEESPVVDGLRCVDVCFAMPRVRSWLINIMAKTNHNETEKQCLAGLFFQKVLISRNGVVFHRVIETFKVLVIYVTNYWRYRQ